MKDSLYKMIQLLKEQKNITHAAKKALDESMERQDTLQNEILFMLNPFSWGDTFLDKSGKKWKIISRGLVVESSRIEWSAFRYDAVLLDKSGNECEVKKSFKFDSKKGMIGKPEDLD